MFAYLPMKGNGIKKGPVFHSMGIVVIFIIELKNA